MTATVLTQLNTRARAIFRLLVESYLETGEPVGSRHLAAQTGTGLSPASIRHVMADLEELGLVYAPHISAGRMPTQAGLRLFVDAILDFGPVTANERARIDAQLQSRGAAAPENLLNDAAHLLSGLTRGASLVLTSKQDVPLRQIEFVPLDGMRALVVLVGEDGHVENRVIERPAGLPPAAFTAASNFLNAQALGKTLSAARAALEEHLATQRAEIDELTARLVTAGVAALSEASDGHAHVLIVNGRANLLEDVKAAEDLERVRLLFADLERGSDIIDLLGAAEQAEGVRIFIGAENKLFSLSGSSLITAPFRNAQHQIVGVLGLIGPTRLNYGRIVPLVDYTARRVGQLLERDGG